MSNPVFEVIAASSFRVIWEEDDNPLETDKNRLYQDYDYPNKYFSPVTKISEQGDDEWWQYQTNYQNVVTELFDCEGNSVVLSSSLVRAEDNWNFYQVDLDTSSLDGFYYFRHSMESDYDKPICHHRSDWFEVRESFGHTKLLEWYGNNANEIPMQWSSKTQQLRLKATTIDYEAGQNRSTMEDTNNNIVSLVADPLNIYYLNIDNINKFVAEKVNIAMCHDDFRVNGQLINTDEPIDIGERLGDTLTYSFKIKLRESNYLSGSPRIMTGTNPVLPDEFILINDSGDNLLINATDILKKNN